jgi:hypothetical protein
MRKGLLAALLVVVLAAGCGSGAKHQSAPTSACVPGEGLVVGAVEDAAKWSSQPLRVMQETCDSGFSAVILSAVWKPGASLSADLPPLRRAVRAADDVGIQPLVAVYETSGNTPSSDAERQEFASYAAGIAKALPSVHDVLVGNEPNLNLFWMPQFGPGGEDAAASGYEALLAQTYDALKAVNPRLNVIGANLAPRGSDDPGSSRPTHSPTKFISDLAAAYRASGRDKPIMDSISVHVYGESSRVPPSFAHPKTTSIGIADYDKLVKLLATSFDGTAQPGSSLPIIWGEYGVETTVPPDKQSLYTGHEVVATVDAATQARYYRQAIDLSRGQRRVTMLFIFHVFDEPRLEGLQSGVRYVDGSPKQSLQVMLQR